MQINSMEYLIFPEPYTVKQHRHRLHCHLIQFPHIFLPDRAVTNAWKMPKNLLSMEEACFFFSWSKEECILKWNLHRQLVDVPHNNAVMKHVHMC